MHICWISFDKKDDFASTVIDVVETVAARSRIAISFLCITLIPFDNSHSQGTGWGTIFYMKQLFAGL
jgi:hypothetical protein